MSQALYRKYRSKSLAEIVGQQHITDVLSRALAKDLIGHAFLFTGPRGVGKTSIARILAHEINQLPYTDESQHLDIIEIDAASNRRIDDIRDLRDKVHVAPTSAQKKVYIIDEVHMLTGESFNALLKTLEEPPAHVVFVLATTEIQKLPATIVSRTQRFHFRPVPEAQVIEHLRTIADKESINIDDTALRLVAQHGEGSFRDSISLLDQLSALSGNDPIESSLVENTLGLASQNDINTLLKAVFAHDTAGVIQQLNELELRGTSTTTIVSQLIATLRRGTYTDFQYLKLIDALLDVPKSYNPSVKLLTTLTKHTHDDTATPAQPQPKPSTPRTVSAPATTTVATITAPVAPPKKEEKKAAKEPEPIEPAKPVTSAEGTPPQAIVWDDALEFIRKKHVPLYSVLKHAKVEYDGKELTLYFGYDLHRKKLDDPKYSSQFAESLRELYGNCPVITTVVGMPTPKDETAASVAVIMGGGEEVDVENK